jgi:hypothetical protein
MDGTSGCLIERAAIVNGLTQNVEQPAKHLSPHGHLDGQPCVYDLEATAQPGR